MATKSELSAAAKKNVRFEALMTALVNDIIRRRDPSAIPILAISMETLNSDPIISPITEAIQNMLVSRRHIDLRRSILGKDIPFTRYTHKASVAGAEGDISRFARRLVAILSNGADGELDMALVPQLLSLLSSAIGIGEGATRAQVLDRLEQRVLSFADRVGVGALPASGEQKENESSAAARAKTRIAKVNAKQARLAVYDMLAQRAVERSIEQKWFEVGADIPALIGVLVGGAHSNDPILSLRTRPAEQRADVKAVITRFQN